MKTIEYTIYLVAGMSEETFSPVIMVDKPYAEIMTSFTWQELAALGIRRVSDLIDHIKTKRWDMEAEIGSFGMENFCYQNTYLMRDGYLVGLEDNKEIDSIFEDFQTDSLSFAYLYVAGGASRHHMGYKFVVHLSREDIHANDPHVHVERDGVSVRYSLVTFERKSPDEPTWAHRRDEKKIIIPYIKNNRDILMGYWDLAMKGYRPPQLDEQGHQYCSES